MTALGAILSQATGTADTVRWLVFLQTIGRILTLFIPFRKISSRPTHAIPRLATGPGVRTAALANNLLIGYNTTIPPRWLHWSCQILGWFCEEDFDDH